MSAVFNDALSSLATPAEQDALARAANRPSPTVAVVGMGYVGLPTTLSLRDAGFPVLGVDISQRRLDAIVSGEVDLADHDLRRLGNALESGQLALTSDPAALAGADAVIIAVPTPVDEQLRPDLRALRGACASVVEHARRGQTLILTSTTHVGTTRELLVEPLRGRGFAIGSDLHVAFAPERINPGDSVWDHASVPRVLGGVTEECTQAARRIIAATSSAVHVVSSAEAAELTKLHENTFRAVNLAFANEMAAAACHYGLDPVEVVQAASSKPYGYLAHYPGPGVGGHCIPVDPYYLLTPLREAGVSIPVADAAMTAVAARPAAVADRALGICAALGIPAAEARILLVGVAYKPGVEDHRESPALQIAARLGAMGANVAYHDPLVPAAEIAGVGRLKHTADPARTSYDLALVCVVHPGHDYAFLEDARHVLDATYRTPGGTARHLP